MPPALQGAPARDLIDGFKATATDDVVRRRAFLVGLAGNGGDGAVRYLSKLFGSTKDAHQRDVLLETPTIQKIHDIANQGLFTTLQQFGFEQVVKGITSFDEIARVAGSD